MRVDSVSQAGSLKELLLRRLMLLLSLLLPLLLVLPEVLLDWGLRYLALV